MEKKPLLDTQMIKLGDLSNLRSRNTNNNSNNNNNENNNSFSSSSNSMSNDDRHLQNMNKDDSLDGSSNNNNNIISNSNMLNSSIDYDIESQQPILRQSNNSLDGDNRERNLTQSLSNLYLYASAKSKQQKQQILIISEERDALYSYTFDELQNFLVMLNLKNIIDLEEEEVEKDDLPMENSDNNNNNDDGHTTSQELPLRPPTKTPPTKTPPTTMSPPSTTVTSPKDKTPVVSPKIIGSPVNIESPIHSPKSNQTPAANTTKDGGDSDSEDDVSLKDIIDTFSRKKLPSHVLKSLQAPCWIDLQGLTDEQIEIVGEELSLHPLTVEQILSNDSSEKCEEFPDYLFIICSELVYNECVDLVENFFYIVLFRDYIVVFHREPLECFDNVIKSFRYLGNDSQLSSSEWLLFAFFDSINECYTSHSDNLSTEVEILDTFSFQENIEYGEVNLRLGRASRKCTHLLLCLFIKSDILSALLRENISDETEMYLNNVKDKIIRLKQNVKLTEDLLENLKNVFISKLSLIMNEESHSLNSSMQKFTSLGLIFMPMNLIAGVFGMNILFPGHIEIDKEYIPFILIIVALILIGAISLILFRKFKLL